MHQNVALLMSYLMVLYKIFAPEQSARLWHAALDMVARIIL
jgi:hypothetical protein